MTFRCVNPRCHGEHVDADDDCLTPEAEADHREYVRRVVDEHGFPLPDWKPTIRADQPEQLTIADETETFDEWIRGLPRTP